MTNISRPLALKPDRPLDPITLAVINAIQQAATKLKRPVFIVGAIARIILLEHIHGLSAGRATTDVDFAFALDHWAQFDAIKALLLEHPGFHASEHVVHRLHYRPPGQEPSYKVDLIPFGGIEASANTITWPPDMEIMMNVAGFSDAFSAAVNVQISPGTAIAVASLPGIAILKLFAWADRRHDNAKDAIDLNTLLRSYHDAGNHHRIYEDERALTALEAVEYDAELAGAWLIGNDVATMASTATLTDLEPLLNGQLRDRLVEDMSRAMKGRADALKYASRLLEQFTIGLTA